MRPSTPQFGGSSSSAAPSVRHVDSRLLGGQNSKRRRFSAKVMGLFSRKPKAQAADAEVAAPPPPPPAPVVVRIQEPIVLKFLFVGAKGVGQTSLLM